MIIFGRELKLYGSDGVVLFGFSLRIRIWVWSKDFFGYEVIWCYLKCYFINYLRKLL